MSGEILVYCLAIYGLVSGSMLAGWLAFVGGLVPLIALDDPREARQIARDSAPVLILAIGWPLAPWFIVKGLYRLVRSS